MARLLISRGDAEERHLELTSAAVRIGRAAGNDLVLDHDGKSVSRFHAELRHERGEYVIVDLNSQNGVWVDGRRVQREPMKPGAVAVIGPYRLTLDLSPAPASSRAITAETVILQPSPVPGKGDSNTRMERPQAGRPKSSGGSGVIARPGGLPKPMLLGGAAAVVLLVIIAFMLTGRPSEPAAPAGGASPQAATQPAPVSVPAANAPAVTPSPAAASGTPPESAAARKTPDGAAPQTAGASDRARKAARLEAEAAAARTARLQGDLATARAALDRGEFAEAQRVLNAILSEDPQFPEASGLLERARDAETKAQQDAKAQAAAQAVAEARRLDSAGELRAALDQYQRAAGLDAGVNVGAAVASLKQRMQTAGEDAFQRAKVYDARSRSTDALPLYQRALDLLPDDHPKHKEAQARITVLRGIR